MVIYKLENYLIGGNNMNNKIKPVALFGAIFSFFISFLSLIVFVISFLRYDKNFDGMLMSMNFVNMFSGIFTISAFAIGLELLLLKRKALSITLTLLIESLYLIARWIFAFDRNVDMAHFLVWISCAVAMISLPTLIVLIVKSKKENNQEKED